jgi:hypothetical protein
MKKSLMIIIIIALGVGISIFVGEETSSTVKHAQGDINFSHKLHADENEIECESCHAEVAISDMASDDNLPSMDDCGNCHDIEDMDQCGLCHRNTDEPGGYLEVEREIIFSHKRHLAKDDRCFGCHAGIEFKKVPVPEYLPPMYVCFECHDSKQERADCGMCHAAGMSLLDIHPIEWKHQHGERAAHEGDWCGQCHNYSDFCLACHRGDNILGEIHDLNYEFTHGLDAKDKEANCGQCHDNEDFCVACHEGQQRMPQNHSTLAWSSDHGRYARTDVENCASCHESDDPTCARAGCHSDFDGIRGTDARIHDPNAAQFDYGGPWHSDDGYYCFQCHVSTRETGEGFCQYCHN